LATKAAAQAARLKQDSDERSAELLRSLQQERDRTSQLERELASERKIKDASGVPTVQVIQDKQVGPDTTKPVAADQATVAKPKRETVGSVKASIASAVPSPSVTTQTDAAQLTANDLQFKDPARTSAKKAAAPAPAAAAPARRIGGGELATLMKRAKDLLAMDDIPSARLLLERAAEAQDAGAALMLARTYDAEVIGSADVRDITPEPAKARAWYQKAADFGSAEAQRRLAQMPN
jgi:TPR repeat protein